MELEPNCDAHAFAHSHNGVPLGLMGFGECGARELIYSSVLNDARLSGGATVSTMQSPLSSHKPVDFRRIEAILWVVLSH